jgi:RNA polymerase sigma-70 factor (ECF subfamily)
MEMSPALPAHTAATVSSCRPPSAPDEAITWIVNEHGAAMLAYATRLTSGRAEAEDVVQEALIRAWRAWARLDKEKGSLRGWLLTVVRNLVIDKSRARASRPPETQMSDWDCAGPPAAELTAIEDRTELAELMAHLSDEERAVLVEVYLRDQSVGQAAETLGIPPGTVKSRTFYALRKLRTVSALCT